MPHNTKYEADVSKMFKLLNKKKNNKGFTLVELVIAIAILAILVGLLAPQYTKYVEKSRKSADASNMDELVKAIQVYATENAITADTGKTDKTITLKLTDKGVDCGNDTFEKAAFGEYVPNYENIKRKSNQWGGNPTVEIKIAADGGVTVKVTDTDTFKAFYKEGSTITPAAGK